MLVCLYACMLLCTLLWTSREGREQGQGQERPYVYLWAERCLEQLLYCMIRANGTLLALFHVSSNELSFAMLFISVLARREGLGLVSRRAVCLIIHPPSVHAHSHQCSGREIDPISKYKKRHSPNPGLSQQADILMHKHRIIRDTHFISHPSPSNLVYIRKHVHAAAGLLFLPRRHRDRRRARAVQPHGTRRQDLPLAGQVQD